MSTGEKRINVRYAKSARDVAEGLAVEKQRKRSRFETMYAILQLCTRTTKKTHIMYRVNLSHQQLEKFLSILLENELLEAVEGGFLATQRGRSFIQKFKELSTVVDEREPD